MNYIYDNKYFIDGMTGWHKDSLPIISNELLKFCKNKTFNKIVDFGCGDGFYGKLLNQFTSNVDGFDISDAIVDLQFRSYYKNLFFADLGKPITSIDNKYDLIFSTEVIEHVENYRVVINNSFSLLNTNGYIFLTTTTYAGGLFVYFINNLRNLKFIAFGDFLRGFFGSEIHSIRFTKINWEWTKGHYHGFSKKQLNKAFNQTGFKVEKIKYLFITPLIQEEFFNNPFRNVKHRQFILFILPVIRIFIKLTNRLFRFLHLYGSNVLVIAKK